MTASQIINSRLARGYSIRKFILIAIFLALGFYAVCDAFYIFPADNARADRFDEFQELLVRQDARTLDSAGLDRLHELESEFSDVGTSEPKRHSELDIRSQYFFIVLCFPLALLFLATWVISARRHYRYSSDGTITTPEGEFSHDQVTGLNLTKWQSKSIARLEIDGGPEKGGQAIKLDAWIYDGLEDIIEIYNRRFHPEEFKKKTTKDVVNNEENTTDSEADTGADTAAATDDDSSSGSSSHSNSTDIGKPEEDDKIQAGNDAVVVEKEAVQKKIESDKLNNESASA